MKILDTLKDTTISSEVKLSTLALFVRTIREKYGNTELPVDSDAVVCESGCKPIEFLSAEDKVAISTNILSNIITLSYEDTQSAQGIVLDRRIEEYVAIDPILCNITATVASEYI